MNLGVLQKAFQQFLLSGEPTIRSHVADTQSCGADTRLGVYFDAYRLRLLEALETDFVALKSYVGDEQFDAIGRAYIDAWPSTHPSLRYFGQHLARFLNEDPHYRNEPILAELATFDWTLIEAFDAPDVPPLRIDAVAEIAPVDWPAMRFTAHPSLHRIDLEWNAPEIWQAVDTQSDLPAPARTSHPRAWVVWRKSLNSFFRELAVDEAWAIDTLLGGGTFGDLCEGLIEWIDAQHVAGHAAALLKTWISEDMLQAVTLDRT